MKNIITLSIIALSAPLASAAVVNINFTSFTGAATGDEVESTLVGPAGGLGTQWNQFAAASTSGSLVDSTNGASTITASTNFSEGRTNGTNPPLTMLNSALTDFGRGSSRTLTISGLTSGNSYDIWLVGYRDSPTTNERLYANWTTANTTTSTTNQFIDNRSGENDTTFVAGYNYVLFENVVANGSNEIVFTGKGQTIAEDGADADYRHGLNGLQIADSADSIPEPSSTALLGLGGLALIMRRRK